MTGRKSFRAILLVLWIIGIIVPWYAFSRASSPSREVFDTAFETQASHVLMHLFLYAVPAYLLASVFFQSVSSTKRLFFISLITVATVAVFQETIQMASQDIGFGFDEIFDFFVDSAGGIIGTGLYFIFHRGEVIK